jgi:hypothetical protein
VGATGCPVLNVVDAESGFGLTACRFSSTTPEGDGDSRGGSRPLGGITT